jgi:uncharacterized protein
VSKNIEAYYVSQLLHGALCIGVASAVTPNAVTANLSEAGRGSGTLFNGARYGRGEVGEFVLIEGQVQLTLGRITSVRVPDPERRSLDPTFVERESLDVVAELQLLGSVEMDSLRVSPGVAAYPRVGDRVFSAPRDFVSSIPDRMRKESNDLPPVELALGEIGRGAGTVLKVRPEDLFGRHCAILGATGGGKSWTTAKVIEECLAHNCSVILIDATGEYASLGGEEQVSVPLVGSVGSEGETSTEYFMPPHAFSNSDFVAMFRPSGQAQGPALRDALRWLRLVADDPKLTTQEGIVDATLTQEQRDRAIELERERKPFSIARLPEQIEKCAQNKSHVAGLTARIRDYMASGAFRAVFGYQEGGASVVDAIDCFLGDRKRLLRIDMSQVPFELNARSVVANAIGRHLLLAAREHKFQGNPTLVVLDEAHHFLGKRFGEDDYALPMDAFALIAKEGRKYGLNICLATQRPRDVTEEVLSQIGTLIVHRLTNHYDREVVERACGELDRSAAAFLPSLRQGEAVLIGTDLPIPLTIQMARPVNSPKSDGSDYQTHWRRDEDLTSVTVPRPKAVPRGGVPRAQGA